MTNDQKIITITKALGDQDVFKVKDVININYNPHPFVIGAEHVAHAADHCGGMLIETTLNAIPCAHPGCNLYYKNHTSDTVCALQLLRNATKEEANIILKTIVDKIDNLIDGFIFVETAEQFRIN